MEPIFCPEDIYYYSLNDRMVITIQSQLYAENGVTRILQPSDILNEDGDGETNLKLHGSVL